MSDAGRHSPYYDLLDGITAGRCVICHLVHGVVSRYLDSVSYESVTDPQVRDRIRNARGLCRDHGRQYLDQTRDPLGLAIINRDVINLLLQGFPPDEGNLSTQNTGLLSKFLRKGGGKGSTNSFSTLVPTGPCPACEVESETERRLIGTLVEYLLRDEVRVAYERAGQLCLPHFVSSVDLCRDAGALALLVARQRQVLLGLEGELGEYVRKSDYRFRHEALGPERDAPARAHDVLKGTK